MTLQITLTCTECGATTDHRPMLLKSRLGTLRTEGGLPPGWAVDGSGARCGEHRKPTDDENYSWRDYDRWSIEQEQDREREAEELLRRHGF